MYSSCYHIHMNHLKHNRKDVYKLKMLSSDKNVFVLLSYSHESFKT